MTSDEYKYIYSKRRVYRLAGDAKGMPIEEAFPGATMPAFLKGAVVYDTPRGRIIAHQESGERGGDEKSGDAAQERQQHAIAADAAETRPSGTADRPETPPALKEPQPARQNHPIRFFRKAAPAQVAVADPWQAAKIHCQEDFFAPPQRSGIEDPTTAAREVRALLLRHFPEGPAMAAQSRQEARRWNSATDRALRNGTEVPDLTYLARRWSTFCRDYASTLKQAQTEGLAPASCNPYADIDFTGSGRARRGGSKARNRERDGYER